MGASLAPLSGSVLIIYTLRTGVGEYEPAYKASEDVLVDVAISRNRAFYRPKVAESPICSAQRYIARKRHSTARLQTDARPSRDGSEQFGSGTQADRPYGTRYGGQI